MKATNKGAQAPAESPEGSASTKGNPRDQSTCRTPVSGKRVTGGRVDTAGCNEETAGETHCAAKLTALLHHVTIDALTWAFFEMKKDASAGVDGMTWGEYEEGLEERLLDLHGRVHSGGVSGAAIPAGRNTQTGWRDTTARHCRTGRQDCPESGGGSHPDANLRAGFSRAQLWVPTGAWGARRA